MNAMHEPIHFQANFSCFIGNHAIVTGETLSVLEDNEGMYWLYFEGDEEPLARLTITDVVKLAGRNIFTGA